MNELLEQRSKRDLERLLSQLPESEQEMVRAVAARGAERLKGYLNEYWADFPFFKWGDEATSGLIQLVRKEAKNKFYGNRFRAVFSHAADLLEEGVGLQTALILAWVTYEVDTYKKTAQKPEKQPRIAN